MGRRKPFIDKKNATTYSLVFGTSDLQADDEDTSQAAPTVGIYGRPAPEWDDDASASMYESEYSSLPRFRIYEDEHYVISEERRKENIALGFPDDGYDYLRHLRALGPPKGAPAGAAKVSEPHASEASTSTAAPTNIPAPEPAPEQQHHEGMPVGPSFFISSQFVPPKEDVKYVDARQLVVAGPAPDDVEAAEAAATVSAFTREARVTKGRLLHELEEVQRSIAHLEAADEEEEAAEGEDWGDWLDEFVVTAGKDDGSLATRQQQQQQQQATMATYGSSDAGDSDQSDTDSQAFGSKVEVADMAGAMAAVALDRPHARSQGAGPAGSIASTYWRPERQDRKQGLDLIDEHFEHVAMQYDERVVGGLEDDDDEAAAARNNADISSFSGVLDAFLREQAEAAACGHDDLSAASNRRQQWRQQQQHESDVLSDNDDDVNDEDRYYEDDDELEELGRHSRGPPPASSSGARHKVASLAETDAEVIAKTKARMAAVAAAAAAAASGKSTDADEHAYEDKAVLYIQQGERWDCESVLSLRSNLENHPAKIIEPQKRSGTKGGGVISISAKTGMPAAFVLPGKAAAIAAAEAAAAAAASAAHNDDDHDGSSGSEAEDGHGQADGGTVMIKQRHKGETPEEKRARKAAVKDAKRASRAAKKELKGMFKEEAVRQHKQAAGKAAAGAGTSTFAIP